MAYVIGVILFALAILISVSLHEAGHMGTAKLFGMRVTRFFVGYGPTLWSFRKGETEYGIKGLPFGGFVKMSGMTEQEEDEEEVPEKDKHRIFWRKPLWQRTVVLLAGSFTHFVLGFLILWIMVSFVTAPNPAYAEELNDSTAVTVAPCLTDDPEAECQESDEPSPAATAGFKDGDRIVSVNGVNVADRGCVLEGAASRTEPSSWACAVEQIRKLPADHPSDIVVSRDGAEQSLQVTPKTIEVKTDDGGTETINQIGI
ncbi:MAG: M50 family metallopeptidase, partial [Stackebrandtia sp.]